MKPIRLGIMCVATAAAAFGLASCADETPWSGSQGTGGIKLSIATSPDVIDGVPATRAPETLFSVPDAADFSLRLEKLDGSYSRQWSSLADFEAEPGFPAGAYNLTAFYGSEEEEGFEKPYFIGSEQLTVLEDRENTVEIEAVLANTLLSVNYTDAFKSYFADWSAEVHSAGHGYNAVPKDEARPVFTAPGTVDVAIDFTDRNGRSAKLQAAQFEALARHHYHVTVDVNNGNIGTAQLVITFDETVDAEDVYIDLTDELFTSPAPKLTAEGFADGQTIEFIAGSPSATALKFNAMARAGISSATLTVASETFTPSFGKEIDLCKATQAQQDQLRNLGIDVTGLFKNPGVFGIVDITAITSALPVGSHTVSLIVKDRFNRVSDPVSVTFSSEAVEISAEPQPSIFGSNEAVVNVAFNGGDPADQLTFKAMDSHGAFVDAPILKTVKNLGTRALAVETWDVTIRLPETDRNPIPVKVFYKNEEYVSMEVKVVSPEYSCEVDPLATKVMVKVTADNADQQQAIINAVKPVLTGGSGSALTFSRDTSAGVLTVGGLQPSTTYQLALQIGAAKKDAGSFTTETPGSIPNGDFASTSKIEYSDLVLGGSYKVSPVTYTHHTSISRDVPTSWATLNDLTCWGESSNKNTWFMVPSTYVENGQAVIRSVGYSHAGTTPSTSGGAFNTKYYCENAPSSLDRSAGELFLGEYSFAGGRTDGIAFSTRPSSLSFDYTYAPYGSETASVTVAVVDASGNVIASKSETLGSASSQTSREVVLPAYPFGKKAAKLQVLFRSTSGSEIGLTIPSGSALNESLGLGNKTVGANNYKAYAAGSVLKVDNVKLNY